MAQEGEILPAYDTSMMDVVLDIGPMEEQTIRGNPLDNSILPMSQIRQSHPLPPAYERNNNESQGLEEPIQPPPAYINNR